ncbi:MAG: hypothetical protein RIC55_08760 [Pirellulaceae bacterium]
MSNSSQSYLELMRIAGFGLAHAVWCVSDDEVLIPFLIQEIDGERQLVRFTSERLEDGVAEGRKRIEENPAQAELAVLLYDGYATIDGERRDALVLEAFDHRGGAQPFKIYQPYRPGQLGDGFAVLRTKFDFLESPPCEAKEVSDAFFGGLYDHQQGSQVWDDCFVNE